VLDVGSLGAWREGKEGRGRTGEERACRAPFYRVRGELDGRMRWGIERPDGVAVVVAKLRSFRP
jgi:hypothetical protein